MRIQFGGSFKGFYPLNLLFTTPGEYTFDKNQYPDYTNYDVMVIGGGGGSGGELNGTDPDNPDYEIFLYGGAGGGGGSYRVKGLLEFLDDETNVVVGAAGADGTTGTDGEDGETSGFGGVIVASGGKGGKAPVTLSGTENPLFDGGDGGIGGRGFPAGGGALGGIGALNDDPENPGSHLPGVNGQDGYLYPAANGMIGQGGGGGAGGRIRNDTTETGIPAWFITLLPTNGGRGSYNSDGEVFSPYGSPQQVTPFDAPGPFVVKPGRGGGARVTPFNKSNATYGDSRKAGIVIIRLTAE